MEYVNDYIYDWSLQKSDVNNRNGNARGLGLNTNLMDHLEKLKINCENKHND